MNEREVQELRAEYATRDPKTASPLDGRVVEVCTQLLAAGARAVRAEAVVEAARIARALVDEQADDEALWALNLDGSLPITEAYLQQELQRLHAAVALIPALALAGQEGKPE